MVGDGDGEISQTQMNSTRFKSWKNKGKDAESSRKQRQENAIELRKNKREGIYRGFFSYFLDFYIGFFGDEISI